MNSQQILLFMPAALLITLAPGPDNLGVLALSLSNGRRASLGFALGCAAGCLNHTLLASLGITALLAASPVALQILKFCGAAYLGWIGFQSLRSIRSASRPDFESDTACAGQAFLPHFRRGLIANAINPKVALFFLAFLPQFIQPGNWSTPVQTACLGLLFALTAALCFSAIALLANHLGQALKEKPGIQAWLQALSGLLFIGLALRLILVDLNPPVRAPA